MSNRKKSGFTLVELLVVIAVIALLMAILFPALGRAREQGKRAVCLYYQRQLAAAWNMYADDSTEKIVCGDAEEYGDWENPAPPPGADAYNSNGIHFNEKPWVLADWAAGLTLEQRKDKIAKGALFEYVKDVKAYKCPRANADEVRSFSVVDGMNCVLIDTIGNGAVLIKNRQEIKRASERMIFIDDSGSEGSTRGGWTVALAALIWWDPPSIRHGDGTTFSFVDGHAEYRKWLEPSTLEAGKNVSSGYSIPPGETRDIYWARLIAWGVPQP
jgi:prepilin-type N-terminal cleavage/methylation domain-containing protein/prepilin-type processing-associated H-X9-DG protein